MSELNSAGTGWTTIAAADIKQEPLLFVQDPHRAFQSEPLDPWCLSCGARVAPRGVAIHTRFHGWEASNHEVVGHDELQRRGVAL